MAQNTFQYDVRVLVCTNCAAPIKIPEEGGVVTCEFCQASLELARRPPPRTAEQKAAADLKALFIQLQRYDPDHDPYGFGAAPAGLEHVDTNDPFDTEKLKLAQQAFPAELERLKRPDKTFNDERRVYWLSIHIANMQLAHGEYLAARAVRETALELLDDDGFRHMLFCAMARNAAAQGEPDAAEQWLAQGDPEPDSIALFSNQRLATGAIALASQNAEAALDAIGRDTASVPTVKTHRPLAAFMRVAAFEMLGNQSAADAQMGRLCDQLPDRTVQAILDTNGYLEPCRRTLARREQPPEQEQDRAEKLSSILFSEDRPEQPQREQPTPAPIRQPTETKPASGALGWIMVLAALVAGAAVYFLLLR